MLNVVCLNKLQEWGDLSKEDPARKFVFSKLILIKTLASQLHPFQNGRERSTRDEQEVFKVYPFPPTRTSGDH
ncbi:unnamed protein product [Caretta caretta]